MDVPFRPPNRELAHNRSAKDTKAFVLADVVMFGFHPVCSRQMQITENGFLAEKRDPTQHYAHGVAYGARPLRGTAEFEVEIASYGTGWSGTLKLGLMRCKSGTDIDQGSLPRYSPEGSGHCVWSSDKIHNRIASHAGAVAIEKQYGLVNLDDLRAGMRVGMRLTHDGTLLFFVNGKCQGAAAENIYEKGFDVYPVIDHYANCKATRITRAGIVPCMSTPDYSVLNWVCPLSLSFQLCRLN